MACGPRLRARLPVLLILKLMGWASADPLPTNVPTAVTTLDYDNLDYTGTIPTEV